MHERFRLRNEHARIRIRESAQKEPIPRTVGVKRGIDFGDA